MTDYPNLIRQPRDVLKLTRSQVAELYPAELAEIGDLRGWAPYQLDEAQEHLISVRPVIEDAPPRRKANGHARDDKPDPGEPVAAAASRNGNGHAQKESPLPLFPPLGEALPYPVEALGPTLSRAAAAIANRSQVATSMAAQSVLAAASLAACPHADVMLPYGQSRPLALFFATIASSGDRKTSSDEEALWPIRKREKILREVYQDNIKIWQVAHAAWSAEKRKIEAERNIDLVERKARLTALGEEPAKPLSAYLTSGDLTIEGVVKNWPDAHPALGLFTAEGATFTAGHGMNEDNRLKTTGMLSELWDVAPLMA